MSNCVATSLSIPRSAEHEHAHSEPQINNATAASFYVSFNMSQLQHTKMLKCYHVNINTKTLCVNVPMCQLKHASIRAPVSKIFVSSANFKILVLGLPWVPGYPTGTRVINYPGILLPAATRVPKQKYKSLQI